MAIEKRKEQGEPEARFFLYPEEHFMAAMQWGKKADAIHSGKTNVLDVFPDKRWKIFSTKPIDETIAQVFCFVIDRLKRKTQMEGHPDYSTRESRCIAASVYEVMGYTGLEGFGAAEKAVVDAAVQFGNIYITDTEKPDKESTDHAFSYAAGSSFLFEAGISDMMAEAFEECWCKRKVQN